MNMGLVPIWHLKDHQQGTPDQNVSRLRIRVDPGRSPSLELVLLSEVRSSVHSEHCYLLCGLALAFPSISSPPIPVTSCTSSPQVNCILLLSILLDYLCGCDLIKWIFESEEFSQLWSKSTLRRHGVADLKMEGEATSPGMRVASGSWKKQKNKSSSRPHKRDPFLLAASL